jgi:hypothetical protein
VISESPVMVKSSIQAASTPASNAQGDLPRHVPLTQKVPPELQELQSMSGAA